MINKVLFLLALVGTMLVASACNTAEGFGEDMERTGEKIQKETR